MHNKQIKAIIFSLMEVKKKIGQLNGAINKLIRTKLFPNKKLIFCNITLQSG